MSWYLCNSKDDFIHVLAKVDFDGLFAPHPYSWSYAIHEDNMRRVLDEEKKRVVFYQKEFDFND